MEHRVMSARVYNLVIGLVLFYGFAVNALICMNTKWLESFMELEKAVLIIGYYAICVIAIHIGTNCGAFASFIGYNLVVLPSGTVWSVCLPEYIGSVIMNTIYCSIGLTLVFIILGTLFPNFFLSLRRVLFISVIIVIAAQIIFNVMGTFETIWWHWLVCGIFCLCVGFEWVEAQKEKCALENAIDACIFLYIEIICLDIFGRILGALSRKGDD